MDNSQGIKASLNRERFLQQLLSGKPKIQRFMAGGYFVTAIIRNSSVVFIALFFIGTLSCSKESPDEETQQRARNRRSGNLTAKGSPSSDRQSQIESTDQKLSVGYLDTVTISPGFDDGKNAGTYEGATVKLIDLTLRTNAQDANGVFIQADAPIKLDRTAKADDAAGAKFPLGAAFSMYHPDTPFWQEQFAYMSKPDEGMAVRLTANVEMTIKEINDGKPFKAEIIFMGYLLSDKNAPNFNLATLVIDPKNPAKTYDLIPKEEPSPSPAP
jgi:hypothetical protein